MSHSTILIIDDEPDIRELLVITLERMGLNTVCAENYNSAVEKLESQSFDCCLTDMRLPDGDGIDIVKYIQTLANPCPVAVITAHGNMELAIQAMKAGAFDFVSKPVSLDALRQLVSQAVATSSEPTIPAGNEYQIIGESPIILELKKSITKLARSQAPVYIQGESGTGKELVARQIHLQSARHQQSFIAVNCGAIPSELMESEFFGHLKGSFTGATQDHQGLFQAAHGGTLFLDEIADLPIAMQVKLLRVIQEKKLRSIGSHEETNIDVRIISASHKDLNQLVQQGDFRQDLFYRINVIHLQVPSLSQRSNDLELLIPYLLDKINQQNQTQIQISSEAVKQLKSYPFPGNVRELENILERATALCDEDIIQANDLSLTAPESDQNIQLTQQTEDLEKQHIERALEKNHWNQSAAARELGITLRKLRYRMEKFNIA